MVRIHPDPPNLCILLDPKHSLTGVSFAFSIDQPAQIKNLSGKTVCGHRWISLKRSAGFLRRIFCSRQGARRSDRRSIHRYVTERAQAQRGIGRKRQVKRGHSSAGRAPALHAGGREFDPPWLHQLCVRYEYQVSSSHVRHFVFIRSACSLTIRI